MKISITKRFGSFPAAHRQWRHDGHCRLIHGHNWTVDVEFTADWLDENGFVVDVGKLGPLKERLGWWFDHTLLLAEDDPVLKGPATETLGSLAEIRVVPSTAMEELAKLVFRCLESEIRSMGVNATVSAVTVWEDEKNSATYRP